MRRVLVLSGPNLSQLGYRQPELYGTADLPSVVAGAAERAQQLELAVEHVQSESEGDLVAAVHRARGEHDAIVVNAGALTHYGWSLHEALAAFDGPVVEVHLTNPLTRESWRHTSVVGPVATGSIAGFGPHGYVLAVEAVARLLGDR